MARNRKKLIVYVGHTHKDMLVTIRLLPLVPLAKKIKMLVQNMGRIVVSFRREIVNIHHIIKLLESFIGMFVKIVMDFTSQRVVIKKIVQKTDRSG